MAALFATTLEQVGQLHKTDDDLIDRLNHRFTVVLLVTFTAFVGAKQFIGDPISCWSPSQFSGPQIAYTNSICWLKGTYYLETERQLIPHRTQNSQFRIAYYQFVPYMLLVMAMLFYLPHMLWRNCSRYLGYDFRSIIQDIKDVTKRDIHKIGKQIHISLEYNSSKYLFDRQNYLDRLLAIFHCSRPYRNRLSLLYTLVKILYLINCLCQFQLLSIFLSFSFHLFGYEWFVMTLKKVQTRINNQTNDSKWFPRVVMCDFMVRHLGSNQHWMSVQCNLPINLFNELIFLIIWAWFVLLSTLTVISLVFCLVLTYTKLGHRFIRKYLYMSLPKLSEEKQDEFIQNYLGWDGILVLRIITQNTNDILMSQLVATLYRLHSNALKKEYQSDDQTPSSGHYMRIDSSSI